MTTPNAHPIREFVIAGPGPTWQDKTALDLAEAAGHGEMADRLRRAATTCRAIGF